jgi:hypothetical protein
MSDVKKVGDMEVEQDLDYQRVAWNLQRIGWSVMALLIVAALLGLFGSGLLSQETVQASNSKAAVEHDRFIRNQSPTILTVTAVPSREETAMIELDKRFVDKVQIEQISPQPSSVQISSNSYIYSFPLQSAVETLTITFYYRPQGIGWIDGILKQANVEDIPFKQFVYP